MKFLVLALLVVYALTQDPPSKYVDQSNSLTDLLLNLSSNGTAFSSFQTKLGSLASNMDSSTVNSRDVKSSVIDLFSVLDSVNN